MIYACQTAYSTEVAEIVWRRGETVARLVDNLESGPERQPGAPADDDRRHRGRHHTDGDQRTDASHRAASFWTLGCGAGKEIRTPDLLITSELLYRLSYPGGDASVGLPTASYQAIAAGRCRSSRSSSRPSFGLRSKRLARRRHASSAAAAARGRPRAASGRG